MGACAHHPFTGGRFDSTDPVFGGSANSYDYVNQNPAGEVDLAGTSARNFWPFSFITIGLGYWILPFTGRQTWYFHLGGGDDTHDVRDVVVEHEQYQADDEGGDSAWAGEVLDL